MSWMLAATAVSVGVGYLSSQSAQNSSIRASNAISRAEGDAIVKERMNTNIRNSYATAINQMNLALTKRQLSAQGAGISAAELAAKGDADVAAASTNSIGSSVNAAISDIESKAETAWDATNDAYENAVENYNMDLKMMVLNTAQSEPAMRPRTDNTQSTGAMLGQALLGGLGAYASNYAMSRMQLGLGPKPASQAVVPSAAGGTGIRLPISTKLGGF